MYARLKNRIELLLAYGRKSRLKSMPVEAIIEATNACNLQCRMCPQRHMTRPVGYMEFALFVKIIEQIKDRVEMVYLHGAGEPLLHPKIFEMIAFCKKHKLRVGISTNATLIDESAAEKLIQGGVDYIIVAMDAAKKETYEKIRRGADFDAVTSNIRRLLKVKTAQKADNFIVLQLVCLDENKNEIKEFFEQWKYEKAINEIRVKPAIDYLSGNAKKVAQQAPCVQIWRNLNIYWDGTVVPCCFDCNQRYPIGNVAGLSVREAWNAAALQSLRKSHSKGLMHTITLCGECDFAQPTYPAFVGMMFFDGLAVKKMLPFIERIILRNSGLKKLFFK